MPIDVGKLKVYIYLLVHGVRAKFYKIVSVGRKAHVYNPIGICIIKYYDIHFHC
jgi:hypothetical protein